MKKLALWLMLLLNCVGTHAQTTDTIPRARMPDCSDISRYSMQTVPRLFRDNKQDSLHAVIAYFGNTCTATEPLVSVVILNEISNHALYGIPEMRGQKDSSYAIHSEDLHLYKQQIAAYGRAYIHSKIDPTMQADTTDALTTSWNNYYIFIQSLALSMLHKPGLTLLEKSLVQYYADPLNADTSRIWEQLQPEQNSHNAKERANSNKQNAPFGFGLAAADGFGNEYGIIAGIWIPTGQLSPIGPEPNYGLTWGFEFNRLFLLLDGNLRESSRPFSFKYQDTLFSAKGAGGGYLGVDFRYHLNILARNELDLVGGLGIDAQAVTLTTKYLQFNSANINIGLGYKLLFLNKQRKLGGWWKSYVILAAKYNYVNYTGEDGLQGNYFTLNLFLGWEYEWWLAY